MTLPGKRCRFSKRWILGIIKGKQIDSMRYREKKIKLGEVCLETNDVVALADFYRWLLNVPAESKDEVHQTLFAPVWMKFRVSER